MVKVTNALDSGFAIVDFGSKARARGSLPHPKSQIQDPKLLRPFLLSGLLIAFLVAGCASSSRDWTGPVSPAPVSTSAWNYNGQPGKVLTTRHYEIHTTVTDPQALIKLPQLMEGAYAQYQRFAAAPQTPRPMDCYIFAKRQEWAQFTARHTGADAAIYLQINRGGYTIGDWFVSYFVGETSTYSVAAHEGWHQYVARHFKGRLPPFLEEGTACMFENVKFPGSSGATPGELPRWDLSLNPNRTLGLRNAIENKALWPLEQLVTMHAGDVVRLPGDRIEAFYSQSWGFARFLWEFDKGKYRPDFKKLLSDTAAGTVYDPTHSPSRLAQGFRPASVQPMLEHYLHKPLSQIDLEYQKFIHNVAYEQIGAQFLSRPGG
jgi:hypothetical protein